MKTALMSLCVMLVCLTAEAIVTIGEDNTNTNVPASLMDKVAYYGGSLATLLSSNSVAVATHIGISYDEKVIYRGVEYNVIGSTNVGFDFSVMFIEGAFPPDAGYAEFYRGTNFGDMEVTVIGRGLRRGEDITVEKVVDVFVTNEVIVATSCTMITNFFHGTTADQFDVVGEEGLEFVVEQTADLNTWVDVATNWIPEQGFVSVVVQTTNLSVFYRVKSLPKTVRTVTVETVTKAVVIGWLYGERDSIVRCGKNTLKGWDQSGGLLYFTFDWFGAPDEAATSSGDSGCPAFNDAGELVGINYGSSPGPYSKDGGETWFHGYVMNRSGLSTGWIDQETWKLVVTHTYPEGSGGMEVYYAPVPIDVLDGLIGRR